MALEPSRWPHSHLLQNARQLNTPAVNPRFYRAFGYRQYPLYLTVFQLLQVPQNHCLPQFRRKLGQRRLHLPTKLSQQRQLVGPPRRGFLVFDRRHRIVQRICHPVSLSGTVMIDQQVSRHARHPSRKPAVRRTVAPQRPVNPQKDVLREVLRVRAIPREPIANIEDAARMAAHKLFPGRTVALEALLDQLGILLQRLISLESWYGDMRDHPRSISRKPWAAISACHTMERKVPLKCSLWHPPRGRKQSPHLTHRVSERQANACSGTQVPIRASVTH